jgi:hypothetical protein
MAETEEEQPSTPVEATVSEEVPPREPVADIMKTKHDTVKNSISNIR